MQPKLLELRPNRSLLNSNFDGYKLSLTQIPTFSEDLKQPVHRLTPDVNEYSLLHAKLFALHNHLIPDIDDSNTVYYIDKEFNIQKYTFQDYNFTNTIVWKIPFHRTPTSGDYNASMKFTTSKFVAVADGMGCLYVLNTNQAWELVYSGEVAGPDQKFIISDVVFNEGNKPQLHLLLTNITRNSNERHSTILYWITLEKSVNSWNEAALRQLSINGFVQYANLERNCEAIYVVSDSGCNFHLDSENEIKNVEKKYKWTQGREDLTLKFSRNQEINKNLVQVQSESTKILVKYKDEIILEGELYQRIDSSMTCWSIQQNCLEIILQKAEVGLMWTEVVIGDGTGEYVPDPGLIDEINEKLAPFTSNTESTPLSGTTFNSQQIEECDFECDKLTIFERLSRDFHNLTHKVTLGSHQILLIVNLDRNLPPAFGVRNDVDVCIWQAIKSQDFNLEHKGTLLAMGYIQASKQQMKFFTTCPDLSYSVICESTKHIFIYSQNKTIGCNEIRNRITGQRVTSMAQQQVYSLPSNDEILGIYASYSCLFILTEKFISVLKL